MDKGEKNLRFCDQLDEETEEPESNKRPKSHQKSSKNAEADVKCAKRCLKKEDGRKRDIAKDRHIAVSPENCVRNSQRPEAERKASGKKNASNGEMAKQDPCCSNQCSPPTSREGMRRTVYKREVVKYECKKPASPPDKDENPEDQKCTNIKGGRSQVVKKILTEDIVEESNSPRQSQKQNISQRDSFPKRPHLTKGELEALIEEEHEDIEAALGLNITSNSLVEPKTADKKLKGESNDKGVVPSRSRTNLSKATKENKSCDDDVADLPQEDPNFTNVEVPPNVAADMMFALEKGVNLSSADDSVSYLFPALEKKSVVKLETGDEASVEVPIKTEKQLKTSKAIMQDTEEIPEEGVHDAIYSSRAKETGKQDEEVQVSTKVEPDMKRVVFIKQEPQVPSSSSTIVQLRGTCHSWFPGYFVAFPGDPTIGISNSPGEVLRKAWLHTKPSQIDEENIQIF